MTNNNPIRVAGRILKTGMFSTSPVEIDIRRFVNPSMIRIPAGMSLRPFQAGQAFPALVNMTCDEIVQEIQGWAVDNLVYGPDTFWGSNEFFLLPEESLAAASAGCGIDCEDGANLILSLCRSAGIPRNRIYCNAGFAIDPKGNKVGHGYVVYHRDGDMVPVVIDWCYMEDSHTVPASKPSYQSNEMYDNPWFSWDDQECWVDEDVKLTGKMRTIVREGQGTINGRA